MKAALTFFIFFCLYLNGAAQQKTVLSDRLEVVQLSPHLIQHISYIDINEGKFPCNGLIFLRGYEAVVMDTPPADSTSDLLLNWMAEKYPYVRIKAVIVNHFHFDCLGGLAAFHKRGIPSFANNRTLRLAAQDSATVPQYGFNKKLKMKVSGAKVISRYMGKGHTADNIITYIPSEHTMFGGCMIKCVGAGKGNLADANVAAWPTTVKRIKKEYPDATLIIPGHGDPGGQELLDYTINLFSK